MIERGSNPARDRDAPLGVSALVLCGGKSRRMGARGDKARLAVRQHQFKVDVELKLIYSVANATDLLDRHFAA